MTLAFSFLARAKSATHLNYTSCEAGALRGPEMVVPVMEMVHSPCSVGENANCGKFKKTQKKKKKSSSGAQRAFRREIIKWLLMWLDTKRNQL